MMTEHSNEEILLDEEPIMTGKDLTEMVHTLVDQYNTLKEITVDYYKNVYNISEDVIMYMLPYTKEDIAAMSVDDIKNLMNVLITIYPAANTAIIQYENILNKETDKYSFIEALINPDNEGLPEEEKKEPMTEEEAWRTVINDIKDRSMQVLSSKKDAEDIIGELNKNLENNKVKLSTEEVRENRRKEIDYLNKELCDITDVVERRKIIDKIKTFKTLNTYGYMYERIDKYGEEEIKRILDAFLSKSENGPGHYVIKKYNSRIKQYGIPEASYTRYVNLEEMFLPEEYHVYNNLFLFIFMRFVANSIPERDSDYVKQILSSFSNLIYHKFCTQEDEDSFINFIISIDTRFSDYIDRFEKDNTTHPNHPARIEFQKKRDDETRISIKKKMREFKIDEPDNIDDMDIKDLRKYFNDEIDKIIESQRITDETDEDSISVNEKDGVTVITPKINGGIKNTSSEE